MRLLVNPLVLRMAMLLFAAMASFGLGWFVIRHLRKSLAEEPESLNHSPLAAEGLPIHAYHSVIQQLKQQKHELAAQHLSERRKAKASDSLSSTILANLSCGVLFLNTTGLVRQTNQVARQLLGFASPSGLRVIDLFRTSTVRPAKEVGAAALTVEEALAPALAGKAAVRGLLLNYVTRSGDTQVLEVNASPVLAEDASLMGTALVVTDKTDIERVRHDHRKNREISTELVLDLLASMTTIAQQTQKLDCHRDPELARLATTIASEAARIDQRIGSFLEGAGKLSTNSEEEILTLATAAANGSQAAKG